jgi:two-component system phosphate regulon response regulator PhoB
MMRDLRNEPRQEDISAGSTSIWSRHEALPVVEGEVLAFQDLMLNVATHRVRRDGRLIHLGPTEFRLLQFLILHPRRMFSRAELLNAGWLRSPCVELRTVDVHISRLRKAICAPGERDLLRTVHVFGYALDVEESGTESLDL